ncbi:MAG: hypothetical protein WC728_13370 [Elusimicrobiota bacterium]
MRESEWCIEKNKELLAEVAALRSRAWEDHTPWSVGLRALEEELSRTLDQQTALLASCEQALTGKDDEKKKIEEEREVLRTALEERVNQLQTRLAEMERIRDEDNYRMKKALALKEAEAERMMELLKQDPASKKRRRLMAAAVLSVVGLLAVVSGDLFVRHRWFWKVRHYPLPYANPSGVGIVGNKLVVSDWLTQSLYFHELEPGLPVEKVLFAPRIHVSGMAGQGTRILVADNWEKKFRTLFFNGTELQELVSKDSPGPKPGGLFFHDGILWSADPEAGKLYRQELEEGGSTKEYAVGAVRPRAVLKRGEVFLVLDERTGKVLRNKPGLDLEKSDSWEVVVDPSGPEGAKAVGMALDEKSLWVLTMQPAGLVRYNLRYLP